MKCNENILAKRMEEKYEFLSEEKKKEWDEIYDRYYKDVLPKVIKRKRKYPEKGDVFLVSPIEGVYFFGVVVNTYVEYSDCRECIVVMIFKDHIKHFDINENKSIEFVPNFDNQIVEPSIVTQGYWTRGYFYTVGKTEIPNDLDYGFMSKCRFGPGYEFVDEYGKAIDHEPKYLGFRALTTDLGITRPMLAELIYDSSILG